MQKEKEKGREEKEWCVRNERGRSGGKGRCAGEVIRRNGAKESSTLGRALCSYDRRDERKGGQGWELNGAGS